MTEHLLIGFYRLWHSIFKLKGTGRRLNRAAPIHKDLQSYRMKLPEGHFVDLDFRKVSSMYWLNHTIGDRFEEQ